MKMLTYIGSFWGGYAVGWVVRWVIRQCATLQSFDHMMGIFAAIMIGVLTIFFIGFGLKSPDEIENLKNYNELLAEAEADRRAKNPEPPPAPVKYAWLYVVILIAPSVAGFVFALFD